MVDGRWSRLPPDGPGFIQAGARSGHPTRAKQEHEHPRLALILIDVQQQYFSGPSNPVPAAPGSLPMIAKAVDAAAGIPVAVIQHSAGVAAPVFAPGIPGFELHPEIERSKTGE